MSILGNIFGRIFRRGSGAAPTTTATGAAPSPIPVPEAAAEPVDIEAVLTEMNEGKGLNWRTSIVDLMKLVGMDSTLAERKELADELGYTGDKSDTATMNIWLHKQVMAKLAANGGRVPADLLD
jgi:Domain of unknown function (DUF3597).